MKAKKRQLAGIDTAPIVASTVYFDKTHLKQFYDIFSRIAHVDFKIATYVDIIGQCISKGEFDGLSADPETRKQEFITIIRRYTSAIHDASVREQIQSWFESSATLTHNIELENELLDRYCWCAHVDAILAADESDLSFKDKLNLRPPIPELGTKTIKTADQVIPIEEDSLEVYQTGIARLDELVHMKKTNLVVVAARTTIGKSTFMVNHAINIIKTTGEKVLYVGLEESDQEIRSRLDNHLQDAPDDIKRLVLSNFVIYDPISNNVNTLFNDIETTIKEFNIGAVFIDYLQLVKVPEAKDTWEGIRVLTNRFKVFAKKLKILLVTASQLKREAEYGGANLTNLFGGTTQEQDANVVLLLEPKRKETIRTGSTTALKINVAKNREGEQGVVDNVIIDYATGHVREDTQEEPLCL